MQVQKIWGAINHLRTLSDTQTQHHNLTNTPHSFTHTRLLYALLYARSHSPTQTLELLYKRARTITLSHTLFPFTAVLSGWLCRGENDFVLENETSSALKGPHRCFHLPTRCAETRFYEPPVWRSECVAAGNFNFIFLTACKRWQKTESLPSGFGHNETTREMCLLD